MEITQQQYNLAVEKLKKSYDKSSEAIRISNLPEGIKKQRLLALHERLKDGIEALDQKLSESQRREQ